MEKKYIWGAVLLLVVVVAILGGAAWLVIHFDDWRFFRKEAVEIDHEAERRKKIAATIERINRERYRLFSGYYASLQTGEVERFTAAYARAMNVVDSLPEEALEEERKVVFRLGETAEVLAIAREALARAIDSVLMPLSPIIGCEIVTPTNDPAVITGFDRSGVTVKTGSPPATWKLAFSDGTVGLQFARLAAAKLERPELEFLLCTALSRPSAETLHLTDDVFWQKNFGLIAGGYLPPENTGVKKRGMHYSYAEVSRAIYNHKTAEVKRMIDHGAELDGVNVMGNTLLMAAASSGNLEIARLLLDHDAPLNARNKTGRTALMIAVAMDRAPMVRLLLLAGADTGGKDRMTGKTVLEMTENPEIIRLLKGAGAK